MALEAGRRDSLLPPRWVIVALSTALILWLLYQLKELFVLLVLGYFIAYVIEPLLRFMSRRNIGRPVGVFVLCGFGVLTILLLALTAVPTIMQQYESLSGNLGDYVVVAREKLSPILEQVRLRLPGELRAKIDPAQLISALPKVDSEFLRKVFEAIGSTLLQGYSITLTIVNLFLLPFIIFYLAVDFPNFHQRLLSLVPLVHQGKVKQIGTEIDRDVSAYIRGQLLVCTILFCIYATGLGIVGVDLWFLLAMIAGFGTMVPYLGPILGVILSSVMALVTFGDVSHLLQVLAVFGIVQVLDATLITPRIVGKQVGLSPLVIILAIVAGGSLFGLLGVMLAVPIAAVIRVLSRHYHGWLVAGV